MAKNHVWQEKVMKEELSAQTLYPGAYENRIRAGMETLAKNNFVDRLWQRDASLWKEDGKTREQIRGSLGWLDVADTMALRMDEIRSIVSAAASSGFVQTVLMGMGGSSLAPLLFARTFPTKPDGIRLAVLDTTDPGTILSLNRRLPLAETLFIVASKSGTTAEPNAFDAYFFAKLQDLKGASAGGNFLAITDPGSPLDEFAGKRGFRSVIRNFKDIGGRYSALSYFGLIPAALAGLDMEKAVARALRMERACSPDVDADANPGLLLGVSMGELALLGLDKLTLLVPESIGTLGLWLEQLIAESTGKENTGILPIAEEPLGNVADYGNDRLFVSFSLKGEPRGPTDSLTEELKKAGRPVIAIQLNDAYDLFQEFYRWEIATAVAGHILGINPFDQPNVQESKDSTARLLGEVKTGGKPTDPEPAIEEGGLRFYGESGSKGAEDLLATFLSSARPSDYVALQAYITETAPTTTAFQEIRAALREKLGLATTLGYGPRYLHSTGQFHKGGPDKGLFIQVTADNPEDAAIPDTNYTFGILKQAQAAGDMDALKKRGRRIIRVHLGSDIPAGLATFSRMVSMALSCVDKR